jgi:hypothetical protein
VIAVTASIFSRAIIASMAAIDCSAMICLPGPAGKKCLDGNDSPAQRALPASALHSAALI